MLSVVSARLPPLKAPLDPNVIPAGFVSQIAMLLCPLIVPSITERKNVPPTSVPVTRLSTAYCVVVLAVL